MTIINEGDGHVVPNKSGTGGRTRSGGGSYPIQKATSVGSRKLRERELNALREKGLAKNQRDKYSDSTMPLTTPEEAAAYLAAMRAAQRTQKKPTPPKNLSSADLDSWYMQQKARDVEMKRKREEAESILRSYRMSHTGSMSMPPIVQSSSSSSSLLSTSTPRFVPGKVDAKSKVYSASSTGGSVSLLSKSFSAEVSDDDSVYTTPGRPSPKRDASTSEVITEILDEEDAAGLAEVEKEVERAKKKSEDFVDAEHDKRDKLDEANEKKENSSAPVKESREKEENNAAVVEKQGGNDMSKKSHGGDIAVALEGIQTEKDKEEMEVNEAESALKEEDRENEGDVAVKKTTEGSATTEEKDHIVESGVCESPPEGAVKNGVENNREEVRDSEMQDEDNPEEKGDVGNAEPLGIDGDAEEPVEEKNAVATNESASAVEKDQRTAVRLIQSSENEDEKKADDSADVRLVSVAQPIKKDRFRNCVSREEGAKYPPEAGRYHLYASYACPWAHRTLVVLAMKGLEDAITVTLVHPTWRKTKPDDPNDEHRGWVFGNPGGDPFPNTAGLGGPFPAAYEGNEPDPIYNCYSIRDLYERAKDTEGKYTVPILWDKKTNTIVSNESADIIRMLNSEFDEFAKNKELDLYPDSYREEIDAVNDWVNHSINNGVYRCGFATTQEAYDAALDELTDSFDRVNQILQKQRFIVGEKITEADVRLFVTLIRFDEVYAVYFKTNSRSVITTPAVLKYCQEIYQMDGVAGTCNMEQIKAHYFCSHTELNKFSIIPRGPGFMKLLDRPHDMTN